MFGKRLSELKTADIERLIKEEVQEGTEIEFKEALPAQRGKRDPWLEGGGRVGDFARNKILEEIIAFANAYGGVLVIGISETAKKPARAAGIVPLPECAELAERLRLQCRDCIEPQVPLIEVAGVPTEENGCGVVVFRVPKSQMAPHRHTVTRECYTRRADRTEKMTMREIQDLTLLVERGLAALGAKFEVRREEFVKEFQVFVADRERAYGVRATLMPLTPLYIERVHNNDKVTPPLLTLTGMVGEDGPYELFVPVYGEQWCPIMRGTRCVTSNDDLTLRREAFCDGLIEYAMLYRRERPQPRIFPSWIFGLVTNALCAVERFRRAADAPEVEYGLEFELQVIGEELPVGLYGHNHFGYQLGPFPAGQSLFPRYSIGSPDEFARTTTLLERDFWHTAGHDTGQGIEVNYAAAFEALGLPSMN